MKKIIIYVLCIFTISCASIPNFDKVRGNSGQNIAIAGMSFIPSGDIVWDIVKQHTYQAILFNKNKDETLITVIETFNLSEEINKENFLSFIKDREKKAPKTGRYERITEFINSYNHKGATCVKHIASSKDYGAKRDGQYTIFEVYGVYCIHPNNNNIGLFIQLSRKAPFDQKNQLFKQLGQDLLDSIVFKSYKI
ncbi:hypothetical protein [bacterium endosymbiont of Bathymodiolus sp. 5 South]|jgi:hypothetical protein|uniref:hypothetical protein n=1 Tax=bacterium endosymbiont of Bathymodiolus sp. 5 South TaxID=1181670 RepID=UPI0010B778D7|nr:hypothetical protein [bacterium endosymbiont of Bathymodiolus sp. 5 South]CAC9647754.1 hypothetical protein [uncultured Gammaproteobacteria bacterium]CAC9655828.1 hypothetical protein [uncultured Gammaproteobacteria bacterium]SHN89302.1 hypothetical protein BCLUESOX_54 [bacterium endosymbiont of Bathymodiolus sp. 5 South]SSC06897.1 hypothetical protein BTURTLESOX_725 [bacterium endosymbiont of Bathymodiolus sp. 5 South]VVH56804.1 hypothetical protein BSPCLSOX_55 [uncultured Gammaproteobacte